MAYSSRLNLQLAANAGWKAYIPIKKRVTGRAGGSALWKKMFHYFQLNRDDFWSTITSEAISRPQTLR
jgi:hypothetical protein